jgi:Tfp pilus assembly protein PilW
MRRWRNLQLERPSNLQAFTLVEMLIALGTATIVLALAMSLYLFGLRSFGAIGNYSSMDSKSRQALDLTLREIRQASRVVGFQTNGSTRWLSIASTNSPVVTNTFTWDSTTGLFTWAKTGQATRTLLSGCTNWTFTCYLRAPDTNGNFVTTTNQNRTKLINMAWTCTRTNVFKINTESIVTAEVVLRNLQE